VTGGTGSFGQRFAEIILREQNPTKLIVYSRDEWKQHEMRSHFSHDNIRYFIGDVRDLPRLRRAMSHVDIVVHAAALKQVPACEYNPIEAVNTNINGTKNVIDAALDCGVKQVLFLSTDKATAPVNIYGATKLVAEKLIVQANAYSSGINRTRFSAVRYGNVFGSRGSVISLFERQRKEGVITVTDDRMTRFWITVDQGVRFVASVIEHMQGGEVFVPKLPAVRIADLAKAMAPDCEIKIIGIRPGEKLHESLISVDEAPMTIDMGDRFVLLPAQPTGAAQQWIDKGRRVEKGFCYSSDRIENYLPVDEINHRLQK
jgi:UDP-N-acetylglucosamine 4,6-dehydratase